MLDLLLLGANAGADYFPRRVLSAGAPLPERTALAFREKTGRQVSPLYGTTETGGITVAVGGHTPSTGACVGAPMRAVTVAIHPLTEGTGIKAGVGRVCVKSPSMMAGYLAHGGIDDSQIIEGWFETGDLGLLDDEGRVHLVGREKEVINVFGMKVVPSEVEEVIAAFPQIADVKVYAGAHRTGSQIVKAAVAAPESLDIAALKRHCAANLAPYKRPEVVIRLETLPRSPTGKIIKDQLP
jgi:acyl-CoA synthetase (AMP-forming)/AMP-acid ligase II